MVTQGFGLWPIFLICLRDLLPTASIHGSMRILGSIKWALRTESALFSVADFPVQRMDGDAERRPT